MYGYSTVTTKIDNREPKRAELLRNSLSPRAILQYKVVGTVLAADHSHPSVQGSGYCTTIQFLLRRHSQFSYTLAVFDYWSAWVIVILLMMMMTMMMLFR